MALFLLDILQQLSAIDRELFTWIHSTAASPSADWFFKLLREAITWIPLYLFILYWVIAKHRAFAWQFVVATLLLFAVTDHTSAAIMKPFFARLRPCFDPALDSVIRNVISCGGKYGMPSTHASNHFGMASFWFFVFSWMSGRRWYWLWIWALAIGYAQVYVGKHYPGDIIVGALLGTIAGWLFALMFRKWVLKK